MKIESKRVYDPPDPQDGARFLVDRLWPRGVSKEKLKIERWMKDVAPSGPLCKWYGHKHEKWEQFRKRYLAELARTPRAALVSELAGRARKEKVTLVFASRDSEHSNAAVLLEAIRRAK